MSGKIDIEKLLTLPHEDLLAKLYNPETSTLEWVAVTAIVEQRNRERTLNFQAVAA